MVGVGDAPPRPRPDKDRLLVTLQYYFNLLITI